jgi:protein-tyrosine phosphatase
VALGERGRATLRALGVRTAVDLRQPVERRLDPADLGELAAVELPVLGSGLHIAPDAGLADVYRQLLEERGERLTEVVRRLARPDALPALVFCSAGKDRTGLVSALALAAAGAGDDAIVRDYAATEPNMHGAFRRAIVARAVSAGITEQEVATKVGSPPAVMRETLAWLTDRHGGIERFLRAHGMTPAELESLREAMRAPGTARAA